MGNLTESPTLPSQFVLGCLVALGLCRPWHFHIGICSVYLKAVPVLALLDTIIQRSSCLSYRGSCHGKQNGILALPLPVLASVFLWAQYLRDIT